MVVKKTLTGLLTMVLAMGLAFPAVVLAAEIPANEPGPTIHVDIPLSIKNAKVVFDIGQVTFHGDEPVALMFMDLMEKRFKEQRIVGHIIGEFYGGAAYLLLNDQAYNKHRFVNTGNPYKGLIAELLGQGVQIEACAFAMKMQNISNVDLLPGVLVNSGAYLRMVQLMQKGYVRLQPRGNSITLDAFAKQDLPVILNAGKDLKSIKIPVVC
jgi:intracellular sulfur oxidation DsrE/DsrF family protein